MRDRLLKAGDPKVWAAAVVAVLGGVSALAGNPSWPIAALLLSTAAGAWLIWSLFDKRDRECQHRLAMAERRFLRLWTYVVENAHKPHNRRAPPPTIESLDRPLTNEEASRIEIDRL